METSTFGHYILGAQKKPSHIPDNFNAFQLCKIFKNEKFMQDFIDGNLYMSTIQSLDGLQNTSLSDGQADDLDGTEEYLQTVDNSFIELNLHSETPMIIQYDKAPSDVSNRMQILEARLGRRKFVSNNICCFYTMWYDLENQLMLGRSEKMESEFGSYAVIIENQIELMNRIHDALVKFQQSRPFNKKPEIGFVEYLDVGNKKQIYLGPFKKRHCLRRRSAAVC